jgi:hypothetical protein
VTGLRNHPLGEGLGTGQIGGHYAAEGRRSWGRGYESELGRLGFEVGILGWVGVLLWRVSALVIMWRGLKSAQDPQVRAFCAASIPLFAILACNYMGFNHTGSSFAWAIAALSFGMILHGERAGQLRAGGEA